jgi:hypothetical protein
VSKSPTPSPQERAMATLRVRGGPPLASLAFTTIFSLCFGARFVSEKTSAAIFVRQLRGAFGLVNPSEGRNTRINESDQRCCKAASVRKRIHKVALASPQVCHTPLPPRIPQARSTDPAAPLTPQRLTGTLAAATPVDKCCLDSNNLVNGIARNLTNEMG